MSFKLPKWGLTGPDFNTQNSESFWAYCKGLVSSKVSKEVTGLSISIGKADKITIRMDRKPKIVTREELTLLAKEYSLDEVNLVQIFLKRKIEVIYAAGDSRHETEVPVKRKKNAGSKRTTQRKESSLDKLQQPVSDSRLSTEVPVPFNSEVEV